jgi:hypothetical protein
MGVNLGLYTVQGALVNGCNSEHVKEVLLNGCKSRRVQGALLNGSN